MSREIGLGPETSWSKGTEITQSICSYHCGIMLGINIKLSIINRMNRRKSKRTQ